MKIYTKMKIPLILTVLLLCSCERPPCITQKYEIAPEDKEKVAKFITDLCEKSNPKSDEEPEDMIKQAEATAFKLFGKPVKYIDRWDGKGDVLYTE